jgi:hypothetical protein
LAGLVDGPFGQVFDIFPVNGVRTDAAGPARTFEERDAMFRCDVGPLLFETPLPEASRLPRCAEMLLAPATDAGTPGI